MAARQQVRIASIGLVLLSVPSAGAAAPEPAGGEGAVRKLILGFENAELARMGRILAAARQRFGEEGA